MLRVKVIYNPKANHARNTQLADELRQLTTKRGGVDWSTTEYAGHAAELSMQAARAGYDLLLSVGGDGTLHEVINGLMQVEPDMRPSVGIVPAGSGNDFVRGTNRDLTPVLAINRAFDADDVKSMDVGYARFDDGSAQYWENVLGIGFDAAVNLHSMHLGWLPGKAMYFVAAVETIIKNYDAPMLELIIDGHLSRQHVQMLTIGNGPREGGSFITTPASKIDDGLLDYAMFDPVSRPMMVRLIPEVMRGTHGRFKQVHLGTCSTISLTADRPLLVHTDGEMVATTQSNVRKIEIGIKPAAIKLV